MATTKTIQATVKNRTDTAANWTQKNPVLAEGEIIVVQTSAGETRLKIGDGVKTFTQLPYTDEQIYNNVVTSINGQTGDVTFPGDFVVNATVTDNDNCTTDKTYTQIQEAVQAGKKVVVKINAYGFDLVLPLIGKFESDYMFTAVLNLANTVVMQFAVVIGEQDSGIAKCRIPTYNSDGNELEQVEMEANPTEDMQIATKKYVDDNKITTAQTLTTPQQIQAKKNITALSGGSVSKMYNATGDHADDIYSIAARSDICIVEDDAGVDLNGDRILTPAIAVLGNVSVTSPHPLLISGDGSMYTGDVNIRTETKPVWNKITSQIRLNSAGQLEQQTMAAAPTKDMQIATKKYVDDNKIADAVLYTEQTLTDGQKKQARVNVDAASEFVVNASQDTSGGITLDKTYRQIQRAIVMGKTPVIHTPLTYLQLLFYDESNFIFGTYGPGHDKVALSFIIVSEQSVLPVAIDALVTNSDGALSQQTMAAAPISDMQIATKKYVDDKISDKEIILSSSTAGSTKKFKLTIDDTGTLTASEITA